MYMSQLMIANIGMSQQCCLLIRNQFNIFYFIFIVYSTYHMSNPIKSNTGSGAIGNIGNYPQTYTNTATYNATGYYQNQVGPYTTYAEEVRPSNTYQATRLEEVRPAYTYGADITGHGYSSNAVVGLPTHTSTYVHQPQYNEVRHTSMSPPPISFNQSPAVRGTTYVNQPSGTKTYAYQPPANTYQNVNVQQPPQQVVKQIHVEPLKDGHTVVKDEEEFICGKWCWALAALLALILLTLALLWGLRVFGGKNNATVGSNGFYPQSPTTNAVNGVTGVSRPTMFQPNPTPASNINGQLMPSSVEPMSFNPTTVSTPRPTFNPKVNPSFVTTPTTTTTITTTNS